MKTIYILLFTSITLLHSASSPRLSSIDKRVGTIKYNAEDVTNLKVAPGRVSILKFDNAERIIDFGTGFNEGWEITSSNNYVYVRAKAYSGDGIVNLNDEDTQSIESIGIIEPNEDWNTNLFIQTSKRMYLIDLYLTISQKIHYKVSYTYPNITQKALLKKSLDKSLDKSTVPRNWAFYMKVNKNSGEISPNYVYDDGTFTYIGFDKTKTFPSAFEMNDGVENIINSHVAQIGNYKVLVIHKLLKIVYLRDGNKLVGVLNAGYGKNHDYVYKKTSNKNVQREIIR